MRITMTSNYWSNRERAETRPDQKTDPKALKPRKGVYVWRDTDEPSRVFAPKRKGKQVIHFKNGVKV